jgi:hypothetical protein
MPNRFLVALVSAVNILEDAGYPNEAATLQAIIDQKGCEHFDPACEDGSLTSLIAIIVEG